jgi:hypothetical protein
VTGVTAGSEESLRNGIELRFFDCGDEGMTWVMTMLLCPMARKAEIIVLASSAGDEVLLGEFWS